MKKLLLFFLLSPFLVCDPQAGVLTYQITGLATDTITTQAQTDGSIKYDMDGVKAGSYSIQVKACAEPWGCSEATPFGFTKPALSIPSTIRLGR